MDPALCQKGLFYERWRLGPTSFPKLFFTLSPKIFLLMNLASIAAIMIVMRFGRKAVENYVRPAQSMVASGLRGEVDLLYDDLAEVVKVPGIVTSGYRTPRLSLSLVSRFFRERRGALERVAGLSIDMKRSTDDAGKQYRRWMWTTFNSWGGRGIHL